MEIVIAYLASCLFNTAVYSFLVRFGKDHDKGDIPTVWIPFFNFFISVIIMPIAIKEIADNSRKLSLEYNTFIECPHCSLYSREGHIQMHSLTFPERTCPCCDNPIGHDKKEIDIRTQISYSPFLSKRELFKMDNVLRKNINSNIANQQHQKFLNVQKEKLRKIEEEIRKQLIKIGE